MRVLCASAWGQPSSDFRKNVEMVLSATELPKTISVASISWQQDATISQKLTDLLDLRHYEDIVAEVVKQIQPIIQETIAQYEPLVFFSYSTGSVLVEDALKVLDTMNGHLPKIYHFMLAPAINGSHLAGIAQKTLPLLSTAATLLISQTAEKEIKKGVYLLGTLFTLLLGLKKDTLLHELAEKIIIDEEVVRARRYILYSDNDGVVNPPERAVFPDARLFYNHGLTHQMIGDLSPESLEQIFVDETQQSATKKELITLFLQDVLDILV